jgi:hypothetical protein
MTKLTEALFRQVRTALTNAIHRDPDIGMIGWTNVDGDYELLYGVVAQPDSGDGCPDYTPFTMRIGRDDLHLWPDYNRSDPDRAGVAAAKLAVSFVDGDIAENPHQ